MPKPPPPPELFPPAAYSGQAVRLHYYKGGPIFRFHYHPEYELALVRGSDGSRLVGDNISRYASGDLVLIGPNLPHTWAAEPHLTGKRPKDGIVIHFTLESLGLDFMERSELGEIASLLRRANRGLQFRGPNADEAAAWMARLPHLEDCPRLLACLSALDLLARDRSARCLASTHYKFSATERDHESFARILTYLHEHSAQPIPLAKIADFAHMSVPSFVRFFKRTVGTSFVDYLDEWRISRACALLAQSEKPILEISLDAGFNNLSHFNRQFLRRRGMTPREYRRDRTSPDSRQSTE